jgi:hypothetical protein
MNYDMKQPGGLTDVQFENPRQSVRSHVVCFFTLECVFIKF